MRFALFESSLACSFPSQAKYSGHRPCERTAYLIMLLIIVVLTENALTIGGVVMVIAGGWMTSL